MLECGGVLVDLLDDAGSFTVTDVQPHTLAAASVTNDADSPTYTHAINSLHAKEWCTQ